MNERGEIEPGDVPRRVLGLRIRRVNGDLMLGIRQEALLLTDSAEVIFTAVDGRRTVDEVAGVLAADYGIEHDQALLDVCEFLTELRSQDLIEC